MISLQPAQIKTLPAFIVASAASAIALAGHAYHEYLKTSASLSQVECFFHVLNLVNCVCTLGLFTAGDHGVATLISRRDDLAAKSVAGREIETADVSRGAGLRVFGAVLQMSILNLMAYHAMNLALSVKLTAGLMICNVVWLSICRRSFDLPESFRNAHGKGNREARAKRAKQLRCLAKKLRCLPKRLRPVVKQMASLAKQMDSAIAALRSWTLLNILYLTFVVFSYFLIGWGDHFVRLNVVLAAIRNFADAVLNRGYYDQALTGRFDDCK